MALKTFNLNEEVYKKFSGFCKENGMSMSKQVEMFIRAQMAEEPKIRQGYMQKLDTLRKGKFIKVDDFKKRYLK